MVASRTTLPSLRLHDILVILVVFVVVPRELQCRLDSQGGLGLGQEKRHGVQSMSEAAEKRGG
jgi:hypothetical protein